MYAVKNKVLKYIRRKNKVIQFIYFKHCFWLNFSLLPRKLSVWNTACILKIDFLLLCDYDKLL